MAVIDGWEGRQALGGTGPIDIGKSCVTMTLANGEVLMLVWGSRQVGWDEEEREIAFTSAGVGHAEPIIIHDGDVITVGGASLLSDEPVTRAPLAWLAAPLAWLAAPHPSCSGEPWAVSGLTKP